MENIAFKKEESRLFQALLIYCIGLTLCRFVGPRMRYVAMLDWFIYRKVLLARIFYYSMPLIGLFWLKRSHFRRDSLFFVGGIGLTGILNHGYAAFVSFRWSLPFLRLTGNEPPVRLNVLIATLLAVVFSILAFYIFRLCKSLYSRREMEEKPASAALAFLLLLVLHGSLFVDYASLQRKALEIIRPLPGVKYYSVGSSIEQLAASPDGKLLAIAADNGFYVWNILSNDFVFSDDTISTYRTRFSQSGKYLAAVGSGLPDGKNYIAVYELPGFKRLEQVKMLPEDKPLMRRVFHDVVFRPDEQSVLSVWHRELDWSLMKSEKEVAEKRQLEYPEETLHFAEHSLAAGAEIQNRTIEGVRFNVRYGSGFLPSGSKLITFDGKTFGDIWRKTQILGWDTTSWKKEILYESDTELRDIATSALSRGRDSGSNWRIPWASSEGDQEIYLMPQRAPFFCLTAVDIRQNTMRELYQQRERMGEAWASMTLLPDKKQMAMLGLDESKSKYGEGTQTVRVINLENGSSYLVAWKLGKGKSIGSYIVGVDERTVAIFIEDNEGYFFFVDIAKGEK